MSGRRRRVSLSTERPVGRITKPIVVLVGAISRALAGAGGPPVLLNEPVTDIRGPRAALGGKKPTQLGGRQGSEIGHGAMLGRSAGGVHRTGETYLILTPEAGNQAP